MSEFLEGFFSSMSKYLLDHPDDPQPLLETFDGWDADPKRLAIYGRFVQTHVRSVVGTIYAGLKASVEGELWSRWIRDYYQTRPAGAAYQINGAAEGFVSFLAQQDDRPPFALDLARFEWGKLQVYHSRTALPERTSRLIANPTLVMFEHPWKICAYVSRHTKHEKDSALETPKAGSEVALIWRHPKTRFVRYVSATPRALLTLKMAMESIPVEEAAAAGGVPAANVEEAVVEWIGKGLVLGPEDYVPGAP
jgi:uncharacterized protein